jgi:hypothetical protein
MSENILAAKAKFERAVKSLTAPRPAVYHDTTVWVPSLWSVLVSELAGVQGDSKTPAKSIPPVHIDAVQLKADIEAQTRKWEPKAPDPVAGLHWLAGKGWRPQDTDLVFGMARTVTGWADKIVAIIEPESTKFVDAACPSCGRRTVYRRDSAGEIVRQPALKIVAATGCTCQHCDAHWSPDRYLFLCRLLGFDLPEGVLE